jgi:hypothetical protein
MNNKQVVVQHCLPSATTPWPEFVRFCPTLSELQLCFDHPHPFSCSHEGKAIVWDPAERVRASLRTAGNVRLLTEGDVEQKHRQEADRSEVLERTP